MDMKQRTGLLADGVLLFFLWGVAVAHPLYDVLARGVELFIARRSQPIDVLLMAAILSFLLPGGLLAALALVDRLGRKARDALVCLVVCALLSLVFLTIIKQIEALPDAITLLAAGAAGTACGLALFRWRPLREGYFLIPAALVALGLPLWFLLATPIRKVIAPRASASSADPQMAPRLQTSVFLIVLDELPTTTLMNESREIDGGFFPGIAALAAKSTWYRNATTVADFTEDAVPAILTGRYPDPELLPTSGDHPENLFSLLGRGNELLVSERTTELCPEQLCAEQSPDDALPRRLRSLASDLAAVYGHVVLPAGLAAKRLPAVSTAWHDFAAPALSEGEPRDTSKEPTRGRLASVRSFIRSIRPASRPALYYLHVGLPHHPWQYTSTGKRYEFRRARHLRAFSGTKWSADTWHATQGFQRHVLQTMLTDRLIAELLERLEETGLYDPSLIILTADHGVSFRPGDDRRKLTATNYQDIMPVPLLVKLPHQEAGNVSDRNVETIDILPTIADVQGIEIPWRMDGQSLGDATARQRAGKKILSSVGEELRVSGRFEEKYDALRWKLEVLGAGDPARLYDVAPDGSYRGLVGRPATATAGLMVGWQCALDFPDFFERVDPETSVTPALVSGRVYAEGKAPHDLAVAVNGVIRAVTRPYREGGASRFEAMVAEASFRPGSNNVEIFAIRGAPGEPRLSRVPMKDSPYTLDRTADPASTVIRSADGEVFAAGAGKIDGRVNRGIVRPEVIVFRGWAADVEAARPVDTVLIFENDDFRFSGRPVRGRAPGRGAAIPESGFKLTVPKSVFSDLESAEIRVFAISGQAASELRYAPGFRWRG